LQVPGRKQPGGQPALPMHAQSGRSSPAKGLNDEKLLYPAPREKCFLLRLPFIEAGQKIALLVSRSTRVMFPTLREPAKGWATQRLFSLFEWIT
jgi:hypothetical protein